MKLIGTSIAFSLAAALPAFAQTPPAPAQPAQYVFSAQMVQELYQALAQDPKVAALIKLQTEIQRQQVQPPPAAK